jgi:NhaP-type Na+/H+ or K+/H+ antiporter
LHGLLLGWLLRRLLRRLLRESDARTEHERGKES